MGRTPRWTALSRDSQDKLAAIARAQRSGELPARFSPVDLLALVLALANTWTSRTPEFAALTARHSRARRRRVVTESVAALLAVP